MRTYERPVAVANDEFVEGIYMASGASAGGSDCYTVTARIHQKPETGREDYRIQVDAKHAATNNHHSGKQTLIISFNQPVEYVSCNANGAKLAGGNNTSTLTIDLTYHNNANDNIGFGDLVVKSDAGLAITGSELTCNYDCGQH